ncbi:hypothetical protein HanXRQr2_Chr17g0822821 [Helianthus annuus]|uniref:Uncharacterized protein n=1 Tax=Helianthus annuus TaxID=4232 RepID=A0A9K3DM02_HELAN|nr:hypothetical protein HanXRQr2_Chr17g0822821 [Helianthus annuus]
MLKQLQVIVAVFKTIAFPNMYSRNSTSDFCPLQFENLMVVRFVSIQVGTNFGLIQQPSSCFCVLTQKKELNVILVAVVWVILTV